MKNILILSILSTLFCSYSKAEYSKDFVKFEAKVKSETISGYFITNNYVNEDSLNSRTYSLKVLSKKSYSDTLRFFSHLFEYKTKMYGDWQPVFYQEVNQTKIHTSVIDNFKILEIIHSSYRQEIITSHQIKDTNWTKLPVLKEVFGGDEFSTTKICMHDTSDSVIEVLNTMSVHYRNIDSLNAVLNILLDINLNDGNTLESSLEFKYEWNDDNIKDEEDEYLISKMKLENRIIKQNIISTEHVNQKTIERIRTEIKILGQKDSYDFLKGFNGLKVVVVSEGGC